MDLDERREEAIAATPSLQPNFQSANIKKDQLNKFQELHRRRLQIKERSKIQKSSKGNASVAAKARGKEVKAIDSKDEETNVMLEDSGVSISKDDTKDISLQQDKEAASLVSKKRQKLYWGLDTKERWERKANM